MTANHTDANTIRAALARLTQDAAYDGSAQTKDGT